MSRPRGPLKHGTSNAYSRHKCRCDECVTFYRESQARYKRDKNTAEAPPETLAASLAEAMQWQRACIGTFGIGVTVKRMGLAGFEVVHAPELCCGRETHKANGRKGACRRHRTYGANQFCAQCFGPWNDLGGHMPVTTGQVSVGTAPTLVANLSGPYFLTLSVPTGGTVFLGTSTRVSAQNGAHCLAGAPFTSQGFATTPPTSVYAVASSGSVGLGVFLSTPQ
jgi:hypothetical protein